MDQHPARQALPRTQVLAERAFAILDRMFHIDAAHGIVLLGAAVMALVWANSPWASSYQALWQAPLSIGGGRWVFSQPLGFWINDALMTIFFLVAGMEIRFEIYAGALGHLKHAALPMAAALGGVMLPAMIYLALNGGTSRWHGWAIPTATDIAFAVGLLALLGRSVPGHVRIFLLTLAIIDDIVAVLMIAVFYSGGLDYNGLVVAAVGMLIVLCLQQMGMGSSYAYVLPGGLVWIGLYMTGVHPALAGIVLGLMTPVLPVRMRERPIDIVARITRDLRGRDGDAARDASALAQSLRQLRVAQRELRPPVVRVRAALHPWVAFGIMPLFAFANAGVNLTGIDLSAAGPRWITASVALALILGKPLGVIGVSWLLVRLGWCRLPSGVSWAGMVLIGLLAGVGFTMSIFMAMLAFADASLLNAAKFGVLLGSLIAMLLGLGWGAVYVGRLRTAQSYQAATEQPTPVP